MSEALTKQDLVDALEPIGKRFGVIDKRLGVIERQLRAIMRHFDIEDEMENIATVRAVREHGNIPHVAKST